MTEQTINQQGSFFSKFSDQNAWNSLGDNFKKGNSQEAEQQPKNSQATNRKFTDQESMRYYILFNTKNDKNYKLKHYNYFNPDNKNETFEIKHYQRFFSDDTKPPILKHYLRFSDKIYQEDLLKKSKSHYNYIGPGNMVEQVDSDVQYQQNPYKGTYSNQIDYINFKSQIENEANIKH